ncbi:MAG TPA: hypothetical protein VMU88_03475, partial [bacterium]|nr:hypothetical protein [bacterium]
EIYQKYPEASGYCAAGLYHCADIEVETTSAPKMANDYLQIIFDHYASEVDWTNKAKELYEEVNHVR